MIQIPTSNASPRDDSLTLAGIGIVAWVGCDLGHELVGHGGACMATGGRAITFSTTHFQCFGGWQPLINSAGILINVITGMLFWMALRRMRAGVHMRYFLWLSMAYNLFSGLGYIVQSSITDSGDWANAIRGLRPAGGWRLASGALGAILYALSVWVTTREMRSLTDAGSAARAWRAILIPYFAAAFVGCAAAALNSIVPLSSALPSAVSSTLGNWGFLFVPLCLHLQRGPRAEASFEVPVTRNLAWVLTAVAVGVTFVVVIGPGVRFVR